MIILVVDDDARSARTLASMAPRGRLTTSTWRSTARPRPRGLRREPMPSVLIVTDLHVPNAGIPIIVVTGYPQLAARKLEPKPIVLTKPLDYADLGAALARVGVRSSRGPWT